MFPALCASVPTQHILPQLTLPLPLYQDHNTWDLRTKFLRRAAHPNAPSTAHTMSHRDLFLRTSSILHPSTESQ